MNSITINEFESVDSFLLEQYEGIRVPYGQLTSLFPFRNCKNLKKLVIYNNPLTSLEGIENLTSLESIVIEDCNLENISIKSELSNLGSITFCGNKISSFEGLDKLSNLCVLNFTYYGKISDNLITKIIDNYDFKLMIHYQTNSNLFYYKRSPFKLSYCCHKDINPIIKFRIRKAIARINKSYIKKKILSFWLSFFEGGRNSDGFSRFSFLAYN